VDDVVQDCKGYFGYFGWFRQVASVVAVAVKVSVKEAVKATREEVREEPREETREEVFPQNQGAEPGVACSFMRLLLVPVWSLVPSRTSSIHLYQHASHLLPQKHDSEAGHFLILQQS
jgi:hypothetical protein